MSEFLLSDEILILMKKFEHNISIETHALDILLLIPTCNSRLTPPVHVVRDIHRATEYDISSICPCNYIHACIFVNVCVGRELQVAVADHDLSFVRIKEVRFLDPDDVMLALSMDVDMFALSTPMLIGVIFGNRRLYALLGSAIEERIACILIFGTTVCSCLAVLVMLGLG